MRKKQTNELQANDVSSVVRILNSDVASDYLNKIVEECLDESGFRIISENSMTLKIFKLPTGEFELFGGIFTIIVPKNNESDYLAISTNEFSFFNLAYMLCDTENNDVSQYVKSFYAFYELLIKKIHCDYHTEKKELLQYLEMYNKNVLDLKNIVEEALPAAHISHNYTDNVVLANTKTLNTKIYLVSATPVDEQGRVELSDGSIYIYNFTDFNLTKDKQQIIDAIRSAQLANVYTQESSEPSYFSSDAVEDENLYDSIFDHLPGNKTGNYISTNLVFDNSRGLDEQSDFRAFHCESCYFVLFGEESQFLIITKDINDIKDIYSLTNSKAVPASSKYDALKEKYEYKVCNRSQG